MRGYQSGNVLFLILLAVALFAALSYAVTQSNRSGGNDISDEAAEIQAARIIQWVSSVEAAVQRMRLSKGLKPTQIDFYSADRVLANGTINYYNNTVCTTTSCEVFHPNGGGVAYQSFEEAGVVRSGAVVKEGHGEVLVVNVENVGSAANEVAINVMSLQQKVCYAINRKLGIGTGDYLDDGGSFVGFDGDVTTKIDTAGVRGFGSDHTELAGQHSFCTYLPGWGFGHFYHVLIPR